MDTEDTHTNSRLTMIEQHLAAHSRRFDDHDRRFDDHDRRFDAHDRRFDQHDRRFDELTSEFRELRILQEEHSSKLDRVLDVVLHMNDRLARHDDLAAKVEDHDHRISALEGTVGSE